MGLMDGKTALIFGVANNRSIAWGITEALHREGAGSRQGRRDRRIVHRGRRKLAT